jgi:peptidoglycan hydrolase CwlO-like protein
MESTALQVSQLQELATNTNNILQQNSLSIENAKKAGAVLVEKIKQSGMSEPIDKECNDFLVKCNRTRELINERRKPVTQLFDQVKTYFTNLESQIDSKGELYLTIQGYRDGFARQKAEETRKKDEEAKKKLAADKEKADITAKIETGLYSWFNSYLSESISKLQSLFNSVTLKNYFDNAQDIAGFSEEYPREHFDKFDSSVMAVYITKEDYQALVIKIEAGKYEQYCQEFQERIHEVKQDLLEKLPSKKAELDAIEKARKAKDADLAKKLKAEKEQREKEEAERLAREAAQREKSAQDEADRKKDEAKMDSVFQATEEMTGTESKAQVRKSWIIEVTHPAAYVQIFQLWFEREGRTMHKDKLEKVTLGRMKKFCESLASKDERIDSKYISYIEDFKAIAKS